MKIMLTKASMMKIMRATAKLKAQTIAGTPSTATVPLLPSARQSLLSTPLLLEPVRSVCSERFTPEPVLCGTDL